MSREAGPLLRERADSYGRDAETARSMRLTDEAAYYEALRDELRRVADKVAAPSRLCIGSDCGRLAEPGELLCSLHGTGVDVVPTMVSVLEAWRLESVEPAEECAAALIDVLAAAGWHLTRGLSSLAYVAEGQAMVNRQPVEVAPRVTYCLRCGHGGGCGCPCTCPASPGVPR